MQTQTMEEPQKVSVLLAEYNTLRAEVMAARASAVQAVSMMLSAIAAVLGFHFSHPESFPGPAIWVIIGFAFFYIAVAITWNEINTRHFTERLRILEADINRRAGEVLLVWETQSWKGMIWP